MKVGRRLAIKILNASKFVLSMAGAGGEVTEALDRAMLSRLASVVTGATASFEGYQYQQALERTESFFWTFCDDYLELVKSRAYGHTDGSEPAATGSARGALRLALAVQLRLFAPFLPFVTEEVWSWWQDGSVHRSRWPLADELEAGRDAAPSILDAAGWVLGAIRRTKTAEKRSLRAPVARVVVVAGPDRLAAVAAAESDIREAGNVSALELREGADEDVAVELAPDAPTGA